MMKKTLQKLIIVFFGMLSTTSIFSQCWNEIETGYVTSLAIKNDGTLWAWGGGEGKHLPKQQGTDSNWIHISKGVDHTLAIKTDGTLWAWGVNSAGQIGNATTIFVSDPVQIGTETDWKSISAGNYHSLAIKTDGSLWAWGDNSFGELGNGTSDNKNVPTQIGNDTNWKLVSGSYYFSLAIKTDGTLWGTGYNAYGQLGDGTNIDQGTAVQILNITNAKSIAVSGYYHSLIATNDNKCYAFGANSGGFGNGTIQNSNVPVLIMENCVVLSTENFETHAFTIHPNPTNGILNINLNQNIENASIKVFDLNGRSVHQSKFENLENKQLDLNHLQNGIYILNISNGNYNHAQKLVKQ